jgi:hypothetical protein
VGDISVAKPEKSVYIFVANDFYVIGVMEAD